MEGPLEGILVVSLDQAVAAPYTASRLADAGARVIKVERPGGDFARRYDTVVNGESAYFVWLNRGKESVELDIKDAGDAALLERMIGQADVFIQNLAPGAAERAGFGSVALRARLPSLITCDISGYGDDGPYRDMKAYDLLVQGESGLASITGAPEGPSRVGVSVCDIAAGMYALTGILEALYERQRTGLGKGVQVSLFDAMADWMSVPLLYHDFTGRGPARVGLRHPSITPYEAFETEDGERVIISIQNEREWVNLCQQVLERPSMASDRRFAGNEARNENRAAVIAEIQAVFSNLTRETLTARLKEARIAYGAVNSPADLAAHAQLRRAPVATPGGTIDAVAPPVRLAGEEPDLRPVPGLGEQSAAIRAEFAATNEGTDDGTETSGNEP